MRGWIALLLLLGGCDLVLLGEERPIVPDAFVPKGPAFRTITLTPANNGPIDEFPVSITTDADAFLAARARPDGDDIYFTTEADLDLPFERVAYKDGTLEAWVLVNLDGQTKLRMHYGGEPKAASPDVWKGQILAAYHLATDGSDSAPFNHDLIASQDAPAIVAGVVGTGRAFVDTNTPGTCQRLCAPMTDEFMLRDTSFSYSFWINAGMRVGQYDTPVDAGGAANVTAGFNLEIGDSGWTANIADGALKGPLQFAPATGWTHVAIVYRSGTNLLFAYVNGQETDIGPTPDLGTITSKPLCLGGNGCYTGSLDEVRVYSDSKEPRWITAEHDNIKNRSTFVTIGGEQVPGQ